MNFRIIRFSIKMLSGNFRKFTNIILSLFLVILGIFKISKNYSANILIFIWKEPLKPDHRYSCLQIFYNMDVLKKFANFIRKHLCWSFCSINLQVLNVLFAEHPGSLLLWLRHTSNIFEFFVYQERAENTISLLTNYDKYYYSVPFSLTYMFNKMVKNTQKIRRFLTTNCLSMFDHFVGLTLKRLIQFCFTYMLLAKF